MELLRTEGIIKTQLSVRIPRHLNGAYPSITFTTEVSNNTPAFPNVYIHELEPSEIGSSLMNNTIHAIRDTVQIEVTTNTSKNDCKNVAVATVESLKEMSFSITAFPIYNKVNNIHRYIIRARRTITTGDSF